MSETPSDLDRLTLYESVAERIARLIEGGTFRTGDRLPSVRALSREFGVSITTVMDAYRLLENRGLIEARPQSGHYVRVRLHRILPEPDKSNPECQPTPVTLGEVALALARDSGNEEFYQFGAAVPNPALLPVEALNRALGAAARRAKGRSLVYEFAPGSRILRAEIARRALTAGVTLSPEDILITNGAMEAVTLSLRALCAPGDTVAVESPFFFGFILTLKTLGLRALEIPTHPRDGMDLDALRDALATHPVKAILASPTFSNPLGSLMSDERKQELLQIVQHYRVPLIEDDLYADLCHHGDRPRAVKSWDDSGLVLWCSSFSKTLAPGWRVGWVAAGPLMEQLCMLQVTTTLSGATPMQLAVAEFLATGGYDHHLRRLRRALSQQTSWLIEAVARHFPPGTRVTHPSGGFVLWVEMPEPCDAVKLFDGARRAGITIAPGPLFSVQARYRNCLRLNTAFAEESAESAVEILGALAREQLSAAPAP